MNHTQKWFGGEMRELTVGCMAEQGNPHPARQHSLPTHQFFLKDGKHKFNLCHHKDAL